MIFLWKSLNLKSVTLKTINLQISRITFLDVLRWGVDYEAYPRNAIEARWCSSNRLSADRKVRSWVLHGCVEFCYLANSRVFRAWRYILMPISVLTRPESSILDFVENMKEIFGIRLGEIFICFDGCYNNFSDSLVISHYLIFRLWLLHTKRGLFQTTTKLNFLTLLITMFADKILRFLENCK